MPTCGLALKERERADVIVRLFIQKMVLVVMQKSPDKSAFCSSYISSGFLFLICCCVCCSRVRKIMNK